MRISPSDFPLLNEMMGGSLYMSLSTRLSWIKCLFLIKMFLRFGKGRISFRTSLFFCKADFCSVNLTSEVIFFYEIVRVTSSAKAFFEVVDVLIEGFSWGVRSKKSKGFALYETFSDPVRVAEREMRILKSLCRFKMCANVKDCLVVKSLAFINSCIWKVKSASQEKSTKILNFRGKSWKINFFHFLFIDSF